MKKLILLCGLAACGRSEPHPQQPGVIPDASSDYRMIRVGVDTTYKVVCYRVQYHEGISCVTVAR